MLQQSDFAYLESIVGDEQRIELEKRRLDRLIHRKASTIKSKIRPDTAPGVIWALATKALFRIRPLVGIPSSDFAGHARHLLALAAAVPFTSWAPSPSDPSMDELEELCKQLWRAIFIREMLDDLKRPNASISERQQSLIAPLMSLLGAVQGDIEYVEQAERRTRDLFAPFSETVIRRSCGITVEQAADGFAAIRQLIGRRFETAIEKMRGVVESWRKYRSLPTGLTQAEVERRLFDGKSKEDIGRDFCEGQEGMAELLTFSADDLTEAIGGAAGEFLTAFAFTPGEVNQEYLTPFDADAVRARPFARIGERFLLLDPLYCSWAPLRRLSECFASAAELQRLTRQRDKLLERDAVALLEPVCQPALKLTNYFVAVAPDGVLVERDLLLFRDGTLLLVESKAKSFQPVLDHRCDLRRLKHAFKVSIQKAYDQACSVAKALRAAQGDLIFFDSNRSDRKEIDRLAAAAVRKVFPIIVLDGWHGLVATDVTPWLTKDDSVGLPWVVDRNTLEAILLKIDSFEKLINFLRWRQTVHGIAFNEDEAVFAGYYVAHGCAPFPAGADMVQLTPDYSDLIEAEYFQRKGIDVPSPRCDEKPVISSIERDGDKVVFKINGRIHDTVLLRKSPDGASGDTRRARTGRNDPCPCGSGRKFKKCCLPDFEQAPP